MVLEISVVNLELAEGGTYAFNYPSAHPLRFSRTIRWYAWLLSLNVQQVYQAMETV